MENFNSSKEFLTGVLDVIPATVFVKNKKHVFISVNIAYCDFFGKRKEEVIGKTDYDLYLKREVDVFWEKDDEVLNTGKTNINEENYTDSKGIRHIIVTRKSRYIDKDGNKFVVGLIQDVTQERRVEEIAAVRTDELKRMNKLMVDRENKMLALKNEIAFLKKKK
jgi:PAS domain S-box-containing protein